MASNDRPAATTVAEFFKLISQDYDPSCTLGEFLETHVLFDGHLHNTDDMVRCEHCGDHFPDDSYIVRDDLCHDCDEALDPDDSQAMRSWHLSRVL